MSELIVFAFDTTDGANNMVQGVKQLQKQQLLTLADAAIVVRKDDGKPKVKQLNSLVGAGALGGAFWGMLIGLLFFAPWLGMAIGAVSGAIAGKFSDIGIDDDFIKEVGATVQPGHSALFLLVTDATPDKAIAALKEYHPTVLRTSLSEEDEVKLKDAFGGTEGDDAS